MAAQRIRKTGVDPAVLHYAVSVTQMKSGMVHLHLVNFVTSPRSVTVDCMAEEQAEPLTLRDVPAYLQWATSLAKTRMEPQTPAEQLPLWE